MDFERLDLWALAELLSEARPSGERRKEGVFELVAERGERAYKVVVAESLQYSSGEVVHLVTHVKSVRRS